MAYCLYLPLDGRPCNARFPVELAQLGDHTVRTPETRLLGNAKQPANLRALEHWLAAACEASDSNEPLLLFLSLDTWLYGNLVASRKSTVSLDEVLRRLERLKALKTRYPHLQIYTLGTLLRLSNSNDDTEERSYWATYGEKIYRYSWLEHALSVNPDWEAEAQEFKRLSTEIPEDVLADYRGLRQRNHTVLNAVIEGLKARWINICLLGCDDSGQYGWNVQERDRLHDHQAELPEQLFIYPGADELGSVLMARVLVPETYACEVAWTHPEAQHQITRYEGIPLSDTLKAQAQAAGLILHDDPHQAAQAVLWLHNPPPDQPQVDQFLDRSTRWPLPASHYEPLSQRLQDPQGLPVFVADVFYANGGDAALLEDLAQRHALFALQGYAAWNTTGNTLGYLVAWCKFYLKHGQENPHLQRRLLMERLVDDGLYQGHWRQAWCDHYTDPVTLNTCVQGIYTINQRLKQWSEEYPEIATIGEPQVKQLSFPWKRFFEVDLQICWPEGCSPA